MNFDEYSHRALFMIDVIVTGNPIGLSRKISSKFKVPCSVAPVPRTLGSRLEFIISVKDEEVNDVVANPAGFASKVRGFILETAEVMDRFSV